MDALRTQAPLPDTAVVRRPAGVRLAWVGAGAALLLVLSMTSVAFGVRDASPSEILQGLTGQTDGIAQAAVAARIPRTVLALLVGAALAMSGATMQAVTRNPLADPGILGVSGGASLAVVIGIAFFGLSAPYSVMAVAIAGAAGAAVFVYAVGSLGRGGATPLKLTLAGAATSAAFTSLVSAVLLPRVDVMETFRFWQIGGVGGATWDRIAALSPVLALGAIVCLVTARGMNSLALGDDLAAGLGENVARTRLIAAAGAIVLCGAATAIAGPIAFVGLVIPHLCRLLVGTDHRWLLPISALAGAALLVAADVVGRVIARPAELEVGILTAVIGAPVFIWIVRRQRVREL
ncbi:iron ABC transporter permease [Microbacterium sp. zg.Y625]|uniref:FecCD family ABC transporter permease n=1 Tax=Microbacterium jiangjiandongii TaxID=3049071 RepID=UPI00214BF3B8|nr:MULTISPECIES: iron ABC transporter permease [unclassified Microbacterium]MCR2792549.1 iron ABC transporter permease [Microbacterium sp. zg.Y625]MCR2814765.1 iron ABC transporter permease [Microbacterium sp. zg.Y843]WIM26540.1 iron ABC transporter permease [Microbacterium sp. zg-Y625]